MMSTVLLSLSLFLTAHLFLACASGVYCLQKLSRYHDFSWRRAVTTTAQFTICTLTNKEYRVDEDAAAPWCIAYCAVWASTAACVLTLLLNTLDLVEWSWIAVSSTRKIQWLVTELLATGGAIVFHVVLVELIVRYD